MEHNHTHHHHNESNNGLLFSIILNSIIVVAEFIGGIISGSLALLSDAIHNLSDVLSLVLSYFGEKISKKKEDNKHTFAFKRAEVVIAFINSCSLIIIGFYIIYEAIFRYFSSEVLVNSNIMLIVGTIGLVGNIISIFSLHNEKDENLNKKSAYLHLFYDAISSILVVVGGIIIYFTGYIVIDLIASIVISLFVIKSGFEIFKSSTHILMQGVPSNMDLDDIYMGIKKINGIYNIHKLHIWSIDSNEYFLSAHLIIDNNYQTEEIIKNVNLYLDNNYHIHNTSLQVVKNNCC